MSLPPEQRASRSTGRRQGDGGRRLVDMSLPVEQRGRQQRTPRQRRSLPAQLDHATGHKADKHRRDTARKQPRQKKKGKGSQS
jgi:hypothetical protein